MSEISFAGRVAVVTGAGRGLGRSHALELARRGAKVVVNDVGRSLLGRGDSKDPALSVVHEIVEAGGEATADFNDVGDRDGAAGVIATAVDSYGTVDVLVNNGGHGYLDFMGELDVKAARSIVNVHLLGSMFVTNAAWPIMADKGYGRVIMTTSAAGRGVVMHSAYLAAKAGITGLALVLAEEGRAVGINVNVISPLAATRGGKFMKPSDRLAHLYRPELVTAAVTYLCSDACDVTGAVIASAFGGYRRVQAFENRGFQFDPRGEIRAEDIAEQAAAILDLEGAAPCGDPALDAEVAMRLAATFGEEAPAIMAEFAEFAALADLNNQTARTNVKDYLSVEG